MTGCLLCRRDGRLLYDGLRDDLFAVPGTWSLRTCGRCGIVWLDPCPPAEDLPKLYREYATHSVESGALGVLGSFRTAARNALLRQLFGYRSLPSSPATFAVVALLACIGPLRDWAGGEVMWLTGRGRLLDVGCGNGRFLAEMKALGWDVAGMEFDPAAVQVARSRGLEVHQGSVHDAPFAEGDFDAVTLSHVIEHVPDPVETLARCRRLLKPGGRLVTATPNPGSFCRRVFGRRWRGWEVPRHLFVYSKGALRRIARRAGLDVASVFTTAKAAAWHWHAVRGRRAEAVFAGLIASILTRVTPLGEEIVLIARKP